MILQTNNLGNFNFALRLVVSLFGTLDYRFGLVTLSCPAGCHYRPPFKTSSLLQPVCSLQSSNLTMHPPCLKLLLMVPNYSEDKSTSILASHQCPLPLPKLYLAASCSWVSAPAAFSAWNNGCPRLPFPLLIPGILVSLLLRNLFPESI